MASHVAPRAEADLDEIWLYVAKDSGSMDIATRLIGSITDRFVFWPVSRMQDVPVTGNSEQAFAASPSASM
jgi:hypothetical protein